MTLLRNPFILPTDEVFEDHDGDCLVVGMCEVDGVYLKVMVKDGPACDVVLDKAQRRRLIWILSQPDTE